MDIPKKRGRPRKIIDSTQEPPLKLTTKRGRKPNLEAQKKKAEEAEKKKKEKELKKIKNAKIYYGSGDLPKYSRRPTAQEAIAKKKVGWWGVNKIDVKLLAYTEENDIKKLEKEKKELYVKSSGLVPKLKLLIKKIEFNKSNKKNYSDLEKEKDEIKDQLKLYSLKIKTLEDKIKKFT